MALFDGSTDAPTLTLEVDASALTSFTLDVSLLDGSDTLAFSPSWVAIPMTDVREIAVRRGRQREDQASDSGTMTVTLDNMSGVYDPDCTVGSYQTAGLSWFRMGLPVRLTATWTPTTYNVFYGRLEDCRPDQGLDPFSVLTFVDGIADAASDLTAFSLYAETTAARANRALDNVSWSSSARTILGSRAVSAGLGESSTATAVLEDMARAEGGRYYVDAAGNQRLTDRADALSRTVKLTLTDDETAGSADFSELNTSPGIKYLVNEATVTNGTLTTTVTNSAGIAATRVKNAVDQTVPLSLQADIDSLATYLATHRASAATRVERVVVDALGLGAAWANLLNTDLGDLVQTKRTSVNGIGLNVVNSVQGLEHTIRPEQWEWIAYTAPVDVAGYSFTLDSSLLDGSDVLT